ncbi:MAG TPA: DUF1565 domain-containing protein, partial [Terriglobales bacterium]|nr:DUF1565 domain-containing protein [Terriglobales bacterium]
MRNIKEMARVQAKSATVWRLGQRLLLLLALVLARPAAATDFQVSPIGSDTAGCGPVSACRTISFALAAVCAGDKSVACTSDSDCTGVGGPCHTAVPVSDDRLVVSDGTYDAGAGELFPIALRSGVSIVGNVAAPENVVVHSPAGAHVFQSLDPLSAATVISGMTIMPGSSSVGFRVNNVSGSDVIAPTIEHNRFVNGGRAIQIENDDEENDATIAPQIRNNLFLNNGNDAIVIEADERGTQTFAPVITGNRFENTDGGQIALEFGEPHGRFEATITDNVLVGAADEAIYIEIGSLFEEVGASVTNILTIADNVIEQPGADGIFIEIAGIEECSGLGYDADISISRNSIVSDGQFGNGITMQVDSLEDLDTPQLNMSIAVRDNVVVGTSIGIQVGASSVFEITGDAASARITTVVEGNTVANAAAGIVVAGSADDAVGHSFSATIANNTVHNSLLFGVVVAYFGNSAGGDALLIGNQISGSGLAGVLLEVQNESDGVASPVPARIALRSNTIRADAGDAVKVGGFFLGPDLNKGNYEIDLGGGFEGGSGNNVILRGTSFDIDNAGAEDVAALCNHFTAADVTSEELYLNDAQDDSERGDVQPISVCPATTCNGDADCDDDNPDSCDVCNPETNLCVHYQAGGCNDFNSCTGGDQCSAGVCAGVVKADGASCSDGETCTVDSCQAGVCVGSAGNADAVCRRATSGCDAEETCDGINPTCPANEFLPDTTPCEDGNECTENDQCVAGTCGGSNVASGASCDDDNICTTGDSCEAGVCAGSPGNPGVICRASEFTCDAAEICDGVGAACPPDELAANGTACDDQDICSVGDVCSDGVCSGSAGNAGVTCRAPLYACDAAEVCDGVTDSCPADAELPDGSSCNDGELCSVDDVCNNGFCQGMPGNAGTVCHDSIFGCDAPATCNGVDPFCFSSTLQPAGTVCRPPAHGCDAAEACDGLTSFCPPDNGAAAGTS